MDTITGIIDNIELVIKGKRDKIEAALAVFLAGGNLLIEDVPGLGKTMLARALAISLGLLFKRIQFTPDLLPSDITGSLIFNQKSQKFVFSPGPIFANIVLADEINRATPRTQSSMLECMGEQHITIDGAVHELPAPFFVIATQNPIETQGTFPLPVAEVDRFMMRLAIGYPDKESERQVLTSQVTSHPIEQLQPVNGHGDIRALREQVQRVHISDELKDYIIRIVAATRETPELRFGASPRASLDLMKLSRAFALLKHRDFVSPDDIKGAAPAVIAHRLLTQSRAGGQDPAAIVTNILDVIPAPV